MMREPPTSHSRAYYAARANAPSSFAFILVCCYAIFFNTTVERPTSCHHTLIATPSKPLLPQYIICKIGGVDGSRTHVRSIFRVESLQPLLFDNGEVFLLTNPLSVGDFILLVISIKSC